MAEKENMKITAIGCLHGHYPKLDGGDLLIVTGDLTKRDTIYEHGLETKWPPLMGKTPM